MTVEILRLSGLTAAEAVAAAEKMLDLVTGPRDLRNLLVIDDAALLATHDYTYARIDSSGRVEKMLCLAVGPAGGQRKLRLPGNLAGTQGLPVLWVSDPAGIDCRIAVAATAIGHPPGEVHGVDLLVEILSDEEMYWQVCNTFLEVPYRVANPGLRLAGQEDEALTSAAAFVLAIRALCSPGTGVDGPFRELLPSLARGAVLAEDGVLARYRDAVTSAAERGATRTGLAGRFRPSQTDLRARLIEAGAALADMRDLVVKLLQNAHTVGELSDSQRRLIADAGLRFPADRQSSAPPGTADGVTGQPPIYWSVVAAIQSGDALPLVSRRLTLTERELKHSGSGSYVATVDERCPVSLIGRLSAPADRSSRRGSAENRSERDLASAAAAASGLADLIVTVASREWSPAGLSRTEVSRIRAVLDGAARALTEYADRIGTSGKAQRGRPARLAESLAPVLRDLVIHVVGTELARPSGTGLEAHEAGRDRAASLLEEWVIRVRADGMAAGTPFPSSGVLTNTELYASPEDLTEVKEALLYPPAEEMWQLCSLDDLRNALNLTLRPVAIGFASRLNKEPLAAVLPRDQAQAWTTSGSHAGLLRLVSLRPGHVATAHLAAAGDEPATEPETL